MNHWAQFRKDRYYLIKYLSVHSIVILTILSIQFRLIDLNEMMTLDIHWWQLCLLPLGLIISVKAPVLIHNCVHRNLKPKIMNQIAGELAGMYVLLSMASFELNHIMHHSHSDSDLDPHNPYQRNFFGFFFANNFGGTRVVLDRYLKYHGDTRHNRFLFEVMVVLHFINVPMRILFWYMLLGPSLFVTFFIPSYAFHMFVFAHINYVTHETKPDGSIHLYNMDSNLYYKFVNFFGSGVYFHKNHHANPGFYNPKLGASKSFFFR
jgi:fatty acid desaturase